MEHKSCHWLPWKDLGLQEGAAGSGGDTWEGAQSPGDSSSDPAARLPCRGISAEGPAWTQPPPPPAGDRHCVPPSQEGFVTLQSGCEEHTLHLWLLPAPASTLSHFLCRLQQSRWDNEGPASPFISDIRLLPPTGTTFATLSRMLWLRSGTFIWGSRMRIWTARVSPGGDNVSLLRALVLGLPSITQLRLAGAAWRVW